MHVVMVWFPPLRCRGVCAKRLSLICPAGYRIPVSTVASTVLSEVHESLPQRADCAEDSPPYSETAIGLVGFEPTASWSRTRRSTKLSHSPKLLSQEVFVIDFEPPPICLLSLS